MSRIESPGADRCATTITRGPPTPMPSSPPKKQPALLRDYSPSLSLNNPLARPSIQGGLVSMRGYPLDVGKITFQRHESSFFQSKVRCEACGIQQNHPASWHVNSRAAAS